MDNEKPAELSAIEEKLHPVSKSVGVEVPKDVDWSRVSDEDLDRMFAKLDAESMVDIERQRQLAEDEENQRTPLQEYKTKAV
ncbi:MAG: hypothetical protein HYW45_02305 [Candidatus Daviesbacteria bacterium]|nr:MAG: hypothetical protein HYW45_02305 [Candidatus Daviesbacteria bacterium]